ncbi:non-specific lipid transfer protein GPI-anchored 22-like isoform X1 [Salvia splendens]|uniref:non-specific lipid transfer protein GPI-anchored 22-like isoform X1 n=1 Tax=Salvia splendens TaxID=180675 RepID=UPI001C25E065|nr:non-specific lipid transfer protein GPI-anchored 22-like isoform X1 [Salvia splendens]
MAGKVLAISLTMLMMFCRSGSDFGQDKKVCQQQLVNLSSCLNFVTGDAKAPSPACCTELHKDVDKSKFCVGVLVRDRNEPSLEFKLNATRALSLNSLCKTNSNATICPELLHLSPNSPEAQIFDQFGNSTHAGGSLLVFFTPIFIFSVSLPLASFDGLQRHCLVQPLS